MKKTIEIPEDHELIQEGDVYRIVKKETEWPSYGGNYFFISANGHITERAWTALEFDVKCWNNGNCFKTKEEAEKSIFYFVLNSEYHYWIPGMEKPKEIPEGCQYFFAEKWNKEEHHISGWESYVRRWPK